jgi:hypothetical protein
MMNPEKCGSKCHFVLTSKFLRPHYCYYYFKLHASPFLIVLINKPIRTSTLYIKRPYSIEERKGIQGARVRNPSHKENNRRIVQFRTQLHSCDQYWFYPSRRCLKSRLVRVFSPQHYRAMYLTDYQHVKMRTSNLTATYPG